MLDSLLSTKLYIPPSRLNAIARPRLTEKLGSVLIQPGSFVLISGPAGFGKTTLLSEFVADLKQPVAWVSLDEGDNDPIRFWSYLITAFQSVQANVGESALALFQSTQILPVESIPSILINDIAGLSCDLILVLDDYYTIQNEAIHTAFTFLLEHLPVNLHILVSTRVDPSWPLTRFRVHNQLVEIRAQDLRFTTEEAASFLNRMMGLNLTPEDVAALEERTEGWVAGLQLAALSMKGRNDIADFIKTFTGSHVYVAQYLAEEVLKCQPDDVQEFLLETSLLERLDADLCKAVTGCMNSQDMLETLYKRNLFVISLDDEQKWYRYHHLFADLLVNRLKQTLPVSEILKLHCLASEWMAKNDMPDEAIHHALMGQDHERAILLVEQVAQKMMFAGRVNELKNWLEALPETSFDAHLYLKIYRTWIDLLQGKMDLSEPALLKMETMLRDLPPTPENNTLLKEMIVILSHWVALAGNTSRAIFLSREALNFLPEEDQASRARVYSALAIAYGTEGNVEQADMAFRECLRLAQASGNYTLAAHTMMRGGIWLGYYGKLHQAFQLYQSIIDMAVQAGQKIFYPSGQGLIGQAGVYLEWNELEFAEKALHQGMELCLQAGLDEVFTGHILQSRLRQAKGDLAGALEELQVLERDFPKSDTFTLTIRRIQVLLAMRDIESASRFVIPLRAILSSDGENGTGRPPIIVVELVEAILSRFYLEQGEIDKALDLLGKLQTTAQPSGRVGILIEMYLLRSLALQKQSQGYACATAIESLERSLVLAEGEGYVLLFAEVGSDVLSLLKGVMKNSAAPDSVKKYARKLFNIVSKEDKLTRIPIEKPRNLGELIEPLTDRELDVLRLLADGLKYNEIAERLFISLNTVRTFIKGIYGKLNVNNRSKAIAQAHQNKLI